MLMLSFGLILFSIVSITAASAQTPTPSVKITSPTKGQKLSDGIKTLTITGTSSDRPDIKCTVGVLINDIKPYKTVIPSGTGKGAEDFSSWKYTFAPSNDSAIKEGNNRVTSKISCINVKGTSATTPSTQSVKYYSVNFTGISTSYKPITPSQGVNFAEMKKPKSVSPLSTAATTTTLNNGIKEHKKAVESALNSSANNGITERKNNIAEHKNALTNELNTSRPSSASNEKGTVFVPPYNIKANSGTTNSNSVTNPSLTSSNQPSSTPSNVIPGKVVISNQPPSKQNSTSVTSKQANNVPPSTQATSTPSNVIPGKVVISNQSNNPTTNMTTSTTSTAPPSQLNPASIPSKPSITITINNNNSAQNSQNTTGATGMNSQSGNSNLSNNNTTTTIINESQGLGSPIPGTLPNGIGPSLIFPIPFHELETAKLPSPTSQLQSNPSILNSNIGTEKASNNNGSPPNVAIKQSTSVVNGQEKVTLNGAASSSSNGAIVSYSWTPLSNSQPLVASQDTNSPVLSFAVPNVQSDRHFAYKLTVTDSTGHSSSATVDILASKSSPSTASISSTNQLSSNSVTQNNNDANSHIQVSNTNSNQNVNVSTAIAQSQNIPSKFLVNNNQVNMPSQDNTSQNNLNAVNILQNMSPTTVNENSNPTAQSGSLSSNLAATNQPNISAQLAPPFTSATTSTQNLSSFGQNLSSFGKVVPVAVAGPDQIANGGSTIVVDGSGSYDPAGGSLSYKWDQLSGPRTTVGGSETSGWSFKLPEVSENALLKLQLTVTNKDGVSSTDYLNIMDRAVTNNSDKNHNQGDDDHNN